MHKCYTAFVCHIFTISCWMIFSWLVHFTAELLVPMCKPITGFIRLKFLTQICRSIRKSDQANRPTKMSLGQFPMPSCLLFPFLSLRYLPSISQFAPFRKSVVPGDIRRKHKYLCRSQIDMWKFGWNITHRQRHWSLWGAHLRDQSKRP